MSTPGSIVAGRAMMHIEHYKRVSVIGLCISIAALSLLVWHPGMPPMLGAVVLGVVAFGIGSTYPVGTVSIQNAVSRYQVGAAMGGMNFFRGLTAAFIVAAMGAIVLAALGVTPERGGSVTQVTATARGDGNRPRACLPRRVRARRGVPGDQFDRAALDGGAARCAAASEEIPPVA